MYYFFSLYRSTSSLCKVFVAISSTIDEVLWISSSANIFENFSPRKDWLNYSDGTDRLGEICDNFISNDLSQMVNFPTCIHDCDSHSPALLDLSISSDVSICSAMAFPSLGNSDHIVVSVSLSFYLVWSHRLWLFSYWLASSSWPL